MVEHTHVMQGERITVRMYRGILGDCFLLRHSKGETISHILIDCGILQGVKGGPDTIRKIATDVAETCNGVLDLVVVTHEHADHISGFQYADDVFFGSNLQIKQLWLAWTENPADGDAQALRQRLNTARRAIAATAMLDKKRPLLGALAGRRLDTCTALAAFIADSPSLLGAASRLTGALAIERLKEKVGPAATRYLEPGQTVEVAPEGLVTYVLGPPRNVDRLKKDRPSSGAKEVYLTGADEAQAVASAAHTAQLRLGIGEDPSGDDMDSLTPFAEPHSRTIKEAKADAKRLGRGADVVTRYFDETAVSRTIDEDWLDAAETLALKLDSDTNNTSLVLAFALGDGQVLLFPGDAQVGNWLSWHDQDYPATPENAGARIAVGDLLRRVTFYKVGHHASHNATLKELGLKQMTDKRLCAAIPVVEAIAKTRGEGWNMPHPPLYAELIERADGRVVRGDGDPALEAAAFKSASWSPKPAQVEHARNGLWVAVTIEAR